jgi:hypothetical protein
VTVKAEEASIHRDAILANLADGNPIIALAPSGAESFYLNPMTLVPGEERIVQERLLEVFRSSQASHAETL